LFENICIETRSENYKTCQNLRDFRIFSHDEPSKTLQKMVGCMTFSFDPWLFLGVLIRLMPWIDLGAEENVLGY